MLKKMVVIIASNGDRDTDRDGDLPKSINSKRCDKAASVSEDPLPKGLETNIYKVSGPRLNQGNSVPMGQPCVFNYNKGHYKQ